VNVAFSLEVLQLTVKLFESPEHTLPQRVEAAGIQRLQKTVTGATMELRSENERDVQFSVRRPTEAVRHPITFPGPVSPAVRKEPLMSTVYRILLSTFSRSGRPVASGRRAAGVGATARQPMGPEVLTCTPWAGLYAEGPAAS
jgi:hypothetical protein